MKALGIETGIWYVFRNGSITHLRTERTCVPNSMTEPFPAIAPPPEYLVIHDRVTSAPSPRAWWFEAAGVICSAHKWAAWVTGAWGWLPGLLAEWVGAAQVG